MKFFSLSEVPSILLQDSLEFPGNLFGWITIILSLATSIMLCFLATKQVGVLSRFSFQMALLINLIFQWPAALSTISISKTLTNHYWYQGCLLLSVLVLVLWLKITRKMNVDIKSTKELSIPRGALTMPLGLLLILLVVYFLNVPPNCTGLFAFVTDPRMTSLAREVSINLVSSGYVTTALSVAINVLIPINAALGVAYAIKNSQQKKFGRFALWILFVIVVTAFSLLPGIKGLIISSAVVILVCLLYWVRKIYFKIVSITFVVCCTIICIVGFDTLSERTSQIQPYNFSNCTQALGASEQAQEMLIDIVNSGGYGHTSTEIKYILANGVLIQKDELDPSYEIPNLFPTKAPDTTTTNGTTTYPELNRYVAFFNGVLNRTFLTPGHVAVLHFKYVEEFGSPGLYSLPFAKHFFGTSIDVPNRVFTKYISTASDNSNKESTGTAPTSSFIAWAAYFGPIGLGIALGIMLLIDWYIAFCIRRVDPMLIPILVGLSFSGALLFSSADFSAAFLSHGFIVGLLIMGLWALRYSTNLKATQISTGSISN